MLMKLGFLSNLNYTILQLKLVYPTSFSQNCFFESNGTSLKFKDQSLHLTRPRSFVGYFYILYRFVFEKILYSKHFDRLILKAEDTKIKIQMKFSYRFKEMVNSFVLISSIVQ